MSSKSFYIQKNFGGNLWKETSNGVIKLCSPHKQGSCDTFYLRKDAPREFLQSLSYINRDKFYNILNKQYEFYQETWFWKDEYYYNGPRFSGDLEEKLESYNKLPIHKLYFGHPGFRVVYYLGKPYYSKVNPEDEETLLLFDINSFMFYQGKVKIEMVSPIYKLY